MWMHLSEWHVDAFNIITKVCILQNHAFMYLTESHMYALKNHTCMHLTESHMHAFNRITHAGI